MAQPLSMSKELFEAINICSQLCVKIEMHHISERRNDSCLAWQRTPVLTNGWILSVEDTGKEEPYVLDATSSKGIWDDSELQEAEITFDEDIKIIPRRMESKNESGHVFSCFIDSREGDLRRLCHQRSQKIRHVEGIEQSSRLSYWQRGKQSQLPPHQIVVIGYQSEDSDKTIFVGTSVPPLPMFGFPHLTGSFTWHVGQGDLGKVKDFYKAVPWNQ